MSLRPLLLDRLRRKVGPVIIAHPGEGMRETVVTGRNGRPRLEVKSRGEAFRVRCPFCNDTTSRLWVNHRWGLWDDRVRGYNLWLAWCYNESHCLDNYANQKRLFDLVFEDVRYRKGGPVDDVLEPGELLDPDSMPDRVSPPGHLYFVHDLTEGHPAREYLLSRGFDPEVMGRELHISYCPEAFPQFRRAEGRLIIPVRMGGEMRGWQARLIKGTPGKFNPKYITMTGMKKSQCLYNYDEARKFPFVVVTEGPTKVWRFGREAVAVLGNKPSEWQVAKLALWQTVVILLDGNAQDQALELYDDLLQVPHRVLVRLDPGVDPGDFSTGYVRGLVAREAAARGVLLDL